MPNLLAKKYKAYTAMGRGKKSLLQVTPELSYDWEGAGERWAMIRNGEKS